MSRVSGGRGAVVVALLLLSAAITGCSVNVRTSSGSSPSGSSPATALAVGPSSGSVGGSASGIPVGPGPQPRYVVQPQPAPGSCHYRYQGRYPLPDPTCTPGATNPRVTQANLATTVCRSGYSSDIRPPGSITSREKVANARAYGYSGSMVTGEYDHLISLSLGGDPNDPRNLWVEPNDRRNATSTNNTKDVVEDAAHTALCKGRITLAEIQQTIATDWPALGRRLGVKLP